jgi:hypothetical protein
VSARAAKFSFAVRSPPRRNVSPRSKIFFCCPVASAQKCQGTQKSFWAVRSHPRSAAIFFWLSGRIRAAVSSCRKFFLAAQLFLLPSGLICAEPFDFFWRMESLQYTFSESYAVLFQLLLFEESAFYCNRVRNLNFFGVFPLTVSGSLTALVRSG